MCLLAALPAAANVAASTRTPATFTLSPGAALSWDHYPALREGTDSFSRLILLLQVGL
ncbi:hypothetical protein [Corallococcus exiguus]|uniref:hypothetical protein n=1 Tax=Corallococcus exiguus TaxID=83462 RepID=UPI0015605D5B|nr:hypothetical protein [Corallococcus exiguus]NRD50887.1 hypothetical protein [Corallococcus exiguus]